MIDRKLLSISFLVAFFCLFCQAGFCKEGTPQKEPKQPELKEMSVKIRKQLFRLEIADTPETKEQGLMYRDHLPDRTGMLFVFQPAQSVSFWMKNCLLPLDMLFLKGNIIRKVVHAAPPCHKADCPIYGIMDPVDSVIELPAGTAEHYHLLPGVAIEGLKEQ